MAPRAPVRAVGVILAGGSSARMGRPKALLDLDGRPLIACVGSVLARVTREVIVVGGEHDWATAAGGRHIDDPHPGQGPLGGLIAGLAAAAPDPILAVACDMPALQPAVLRLVLRRLDGYDAAVPRVGGRAQPLHAAYGSSSLPALRRSFERGERSVTRTLDRLRVAFVDDGAWRSADPSGRSFTSLDTPAAYDEFLRRRQETAGRAANSDHEPVEHSTGGGGI